MVTCLVGRNLEKAQLGETSLQLLHVLFQMQLLRLTHLKDDLRLNAGLAVDALQANMVSFRYTCRRYVYTGAFSARPFHVYRARGLNDR